MDQHQRAARESRSAREALRLAADDAFVMGEVALVLCETGDGEEGWQLADRRAQMEPDALWALAGLLRAQSATRRYRDAIATARAVTDRDPNLGWVWALYAEALDAGTTP